VSRLGEMTLAWASMFSLERNTFDLSDLGRISSLFSLFLAFSFVPLNFFPLSAPLYLKFTQNKDQVTSFQQKLENM